MAEIASPRTGDKTVVLIDGARGHVEIDRSTPLIRLNYFDGKFLRADDMTLEQRAHRKHVAISNQAGGAGIVHGLECTLEKEGPLRIGPGLAMDPAGNLILLQQAIEVEVDKLIDESAKLVTKITSARALSSAKRLGAFGDCELARSSASPAREANGPQLYIISLAHVEALCGIEDVYGKLCERACITSTARPYVVEGVMVRATKLNLPLQPQHNGRDLRSRVASAYFRAEQGLLGLESPLPGIPAAGGRVRRTSVSGWINSNIWCGGAHLPGGEGVPIAVLAHEETSTLFVDSWIVRRERMDSPAKHYWAWRLAMRPWNVFLAQVLQFQCHLHDIFSSIPPDADPGDPDDPCQKAKVDLSDAADWLEAASKVVTGAIAPPSPPSPIELVPPGFGDAPLLPGFDTNGFRELAARLRTAAQGIHPLPTGQVLINRGILELPSAGYLPVNRAIGTSVTAEVKNLLGPGVDLRFCIVRADYVPHAFEEAQHMDRISLVDGLSRDATKPLVEILVPDGELHSKLGPTAHAVSNPARAEFPTFNPPLNLTPIFPALSDQDLRATMDWVLFRRPRDKTCLGAAPPKPAPTWRYPIYHLQVQNQAELKEITDGLDQQPSNAHPAFARLGDVVFASLTTEPVLVPSTLKTDWENEKADGFLVHGAIANAVTVPTEEAELADDRLNKVQASLGETPRLPTRLRGVPESTAVADAAGVILLVTMKPQPVATTCQAVYRMTTGAQLDRLDPFIKGPASENAPAFANFVASVRFKSGSPGFSETPRELRDRWGPVAENEVISSALIVAGPQAAVIPSEAPNFRAQARAILHQLGNPIDVRVPSVVHRPAGLPAGVSCPSMLFIATEVRGAVRRARLVRRIPGSGSPIDAPTIAFKADGKLAEPGLADVARALGEQGQIGLVQIASGNRVDDPGLRSRLETFIAAASARGLLAPGPYFRSEVVELETAAERKLPRLPDGTMVDDIIFVAKS